MNALIWLVSVALPFAPAIVLAVVLSGTFTDMHVITPLNWIVAVFVALMFEMSGAVAGKAYQSRIRREGVWNTGLLFVLVYIFAVVVVVLYADGEIESKLLVGMLIAFPVVSIGVYINLAALEQNAAEDGTEAERVAMALEFERKQREQELAEQANAAEFKRLQKAKDAEARRTIRLHKFSERSANNSERSAEKVNDSEYPANFPLLIDTVHSSTDGAEYGIDVISELSGLGKTQSYKLVKYGIETGKIIKAGRGVYKNAGGNNEYK